MALNHFSGNYEDALNPYYDKVNADIKDINGIDCFKGIPANIDSYNSCLVVFKTPHFFTPQVNYAINDGKYVELYINEPFFESFDIAQRQFEVTIINVHPDIRPKNLDGQFLTTVIGSAGANYGYSAYQFQFSNSGELLTIDFLQNSLVNAIDFGTTLDLSINLKVVYPLN